MSAQPMPAAHKGNVAAVGSFGLMLCIVAGLQTAALAWMIYDRVSLLGGGREVVLDTAPFDPRSLFRGDYVILNYRISTLDPAKLDGEDALVAGQAVYITLARPEGPEPAGKLAAWTPVSLATRHPGEVGAQRAVIRGKLWALSGTALRIKYGIESYFVPEGEGRRLESQARTGNIRVLVAVASDGKAAIKGLVLDGKLRYEEPLF